MEVGLALGAGSARGLAHIGVIEVLEKAGVAFDIIAGTSTGAVIGALYAGGSSIRVIHQLASYHGPKRRSLFDPSLPKTGLIGGKRIRDLLISTLGAGTEFKDLKMPFACVATDIMTGEEVVFDRGNLVEALRASIAIPIIFSVVKNKERYLLDGGLVNPVPVSVARAMGADFVIAVNVIPHVADHNAHSRRNAGGEAAEPNIIQVIMQSIHIGTNCLTQVSLQGANAVIEPNVARFGPGDFHRVEQIIVQGRRAATKALPEIKRRLETAKSLDRSISIERNVKKAS